MGGPGRPLPDPDQWLNEKAKPALPDPDQWVAEKANAQPVSPPVAPAHTPPASPSILDMGIGGGGLTLRGVGEALSKPLLPVRKAIEPVAEAIRGIKLPTATMGLGRMDEAADYLLGAGESVEGLTSPASLGTIAGLTGLATVGAPGLILAGAAGVGMTAKGLYDSTQEIEQAGAVGDESRARQVKGRLATDVLSNFIPFGAALPKLRAQRTADMGVRSKANYGEVLAFDYLDQPTLDITVEKIKADPMLAPDARAKLLATAEQRASAMQAPPQPPPARVQPTPRPQPAPAPTPAPSPVVPEQPIIRPQEPGTGSTPPLPIKMPPRIPETPNATAPMRDRQRRGLFAAANERGFDSDDLARLAGKRVSEMTQGDADDLFMQLRAMTPEDVAQFKAERPPREEPLFDAAQEVLGKPEPEPEPVAVATPDVVPEKRLRKPRKFDASKSIVNAIKASGGISKERVAKAGLQGEWLRIPTKVRKQISSGESVHGFDTILDELRNAGWNVKDENDLLAILGDSERAFKRDRAEPEIDPMAQATHEIEQLRAEIERLKAERQPGDEEITFDPEEWKGQEGAADILRFPERRPLEDSPDLGPFRELSKRYWTVRDRADMVRGADPEFASMLDETAERLLKEVGTLGPKMKREPGAVLKFIKDQSGMARFRDDATGDLFAERKILEAAGRSPRLAEPEGPRPVRDFADEMLSAQEETRGAARDEAVNRVLQAPDTTRTSKREQLGLSKPKAPEVKGPLFEKQQKKQKGLFGDDAGMARLINRPWSEEDPEMGRILRRVREAKKNAERPPNKLLPERGEGDIPGELASAVGRIRSLDQVLLRTEATRPVATAIKTGERDKKKDMQRYYDLSTDILTGIKRKSHDAMAVYRLLDGKVTPDALRAEGRGDAERAITAANRLRSEVFDPIISAIRDPEMAKVVGQTGYLTNYFPHLMKNARRTLGDDATGIFWDLVPKKLRSRFLNPREKNAPDYETDLFEVLPIYINASMKTLHDLPAYAKAIESLKNVPEGAFKNLAKWYADNYVGQPKMKVGSAPNEWASEISRRISKVYYDAYLGANPASAALNLTQTMTNTYPELGARWTAAGVKDLATSPERRDILHRSGLLFDYPGLEGELQTNSFKDKTLYGLFRGAEYVNRGVAFLGGLRKAESIGLTGRAAEHFALNVVDKTQFSYTKGSAVYALEKTPTALRTFQTFALKEAEFVSNLFADAIKGGAKEKAKLGRFLIVAVGLPIAATQAGLDKKTVERYTLGFSNLIPGLSPFARDLASLSRYAWEVETGKRKIEDVPMDAIKKAATLLPGAKAAENIARDVGILEKKR